MFDTHYQMQKKALYLILLLCIHIAGGQECPRVTNPANGSIAVPVNTTITWPAVNGITGYLISLGTTPGGVDILNRRSAGLVNSYTPEVGLPENTLIYVTLSMFLANGPLLDCPGETFQTEDVTSPPLCTSLVKPLDLQFNVPVGTPIEWAYASKATGYRISIGTEPGSTDIADDVDVGNLLSYRLPVELPEDSQIYVRVTPYNENGSAAGCKEESFNTGFAVVDCSPYFDAALGTLVEISPKIDFPAVIGLCPNALPLTLNGDTEADGFRWYRLEGETEVLISESPEVTLADEGRYRYEVYNFLPQSANAAECITSHEFIAVLSESPTITSVGVSRQSDGVEITVEVSGRGDYEFALDQVDGPYQDSNIFRAIPPGDHTVYVRDKNGCGIASKPVERELTPGDFPKFFTPNGDGINDFWQLQPATANKIIKLEYLQVFDRYGTLLAQLTPNSPGWDGNFNGRPLPSTVYWFKAEDNYKNIVKGYFMLKR